MWINFVNVLVLLLTVSGTVICEPGKAQASQWNFVDSMQMHVLDYTAEGADWSEPFLVYRATPGLPEPEQGLSNCNAGNFPGQLKLLKNHKSGSRHLKPGSYRYLQAFKVTINRSYTSDYFHCEQGNCEFRLTCLKGPCRTPLSHIRHHFFRTGIKQGVANIQVSACNRPYTCARDVCQPAETGRLRIRECSGQRPAGADCFFAFTTSGEGSSFRILERSQPLRIDWEKNLQETLSQVWTGSAGEQPD